MTHDQAHVPYALRGGHTAERRRAFENFNIHVDVALRERPRGGGSGGATADDDDALRHGCDVISSSASDVVVGRRVSVGETHVARAGRRVSHVARAWRDATVAHRASRARFGW
jgi:hypothetical protein